MGGSGGSASVSPTTGMEKTGNADIDRRIRRQIANCNERRRMQVIQKKTEQMSRVKLNIVIFSNIAGEGGGVR